MAGTDVAIKAISANPVSNGTGTMLNNPTIADRIVIDNPHAYPTDPVAIENKETNRFDDYKYYTT